MRISMLFVGIGMGIALTGAVLQSLAIIGAAAIFVWFGAGLLSRYLNKADGAAHEEHINRALSALSHKPIPMGVMVRPSGDLEH